MKALGMANAAESKDIQIRAPEIAENGAVVPIDVTSTIPGTTSISVFIDKNPFPYTGTFDVSQGALPFVHLRVKIGESSPVRVVVAAGGKHFTTAKEVKVTIGGCGG
jgi:sulfur-oxidizing protein SoxY